MPIDTSSMPKSVGTATGISHILTSHKSKCGLVGCNPLPVLEVSLSDRHLGIFTYPVRPYSLNLPLRAEELSRCWPFVAIIGIGVKIFFDEKLLSQLAKKWTSTFHQTTSLSLTMSRLAALRGSSTEAGLTAAVRGFLNGIWTIRDREMFQETPTPIPIGMFFLSNVAFI